jgi:acetyltransferase-like isoleucine patch superfamily enzyme
MLANHIPEGTVIGALSFVPVEFEFSPWTVYAGIPIKPVKSRDRESVMRQLDIFVKQVTISGK